MLQGLVVRLRVVTSHGSKSASKEASSARLNSHEFSYQDEKCSRSRETSGRHESRVLNCMEGCCKCPSEFSRIQLQNPIRAFIHPLNTSTPLNDSPKTSLLGTPSH